MRIDSYFSGEMMVSKGSLGCEIPFCEANWGMRKIQASILLFLLVALAKGEPGGKTWPSRFKNSQPVLSSLPDHESATVWSSGNFVILCEIELPRPRLESLARTIESVPRLFKRLPLPLWLPPASEQAVLRLCANETNFVARGAPVDAAGCYLPRRGEIVIRGDLYLNPPQAKATRLQVGPNDDLLIHELTHLAMHQYGGRLPAWLSEGLAEYFASCHLGKGHFDFSQSSRLIRQHIEKFYPIERYPALSLPPLEILAERNGNEWLRSNREAAPEDRYRPYAAALLLAHYHLEGGRARREALSKTLSAALETRTRQKILEDPETIEKKLMTYWKAKGLLIDFAFEQADTPNFENRR